MSRKMMMLLLLVCFGAIVCAVAAQGAPEDNRGKESAKARLEVARKGLAIVETGDAYDGVFIWSKRVLDAELDLSGNEAERMAALAANLTRTKRLEDVAKALHARGLVSELEVLEAEYHRYDAEVQLAEARAAKASTRK
jgi:hypothetical protein